MHNKNPVNSPAITTGGDILFGSEDYCFYCVSSDGRLKWKVRTWLEVSGSALVVPDGGIFWGSCDCYFYGLSPDGTIKWKVLAGNAVVGSPAISPAGDVIYYTVSWLESPPAEGGKANFPVLFAIDRQGNILWSFKGPAGMSGSPLVDSAGNIYILDDKSMFYALDRDGKLLWKINLWGKNDRPSRFDVDTSLDIFASSPSMGKDGTIYVGSGDGSLYAIGKL